MGPFELLTLLLLLYCAIPSPMRLPTTPEEAAGNKREKHYARQVSSKTVPEQHLKEPYDGTLSATC
jgi:hypothetical protein